MIDLDKWIFIPYDCESKLPSNIKIESSDACSDEITYHHTNTHYDFIWSEKKPNEMNVTFDGKFCGKLFSDNNDASKYYLMRLDWLIYQAKTELIEKNNLITKLSQKRKELAINQISKKN